MLDDRGTSVYFAQCDFGGPIKIGHSINRPGRIEALSKDLPFTLVEIGSFPGGLFRERFVQCWFRRFRIKGEWFQPVPLLWRWALQARAHGRIAGIPEEPPQSYCWTAEDIRKSLEVHRIHPQTLASAIEVEPTYLDRVILRKGAVVSTKVLAAYAVCRWSRGEHVDWDRVGHMHSDLYKIEQMKAATSGAVTPNDFLATAPPSEVPA